MPGRKSTPHVRLSPERSKALGERVRQARQHAEVTQEALSHASGVGAEHIQRIERGAANPTVATIYAIGDALQVQARTLMPD
ncbi:helix-turn-helix domain-containing protein [Geodermatophilus siccatus]|uniref:helix-turn-helix domain-containing protein n=1 Tax=Geodermatophilus siccatus TaxID=1137991 RepID=UPI0015871EA9